MRRTVRRRFGVHWNEKSALVYRPDSSVWKKMYLDPYIIIYHIQM